MKPGATDPNAVAKKDNPGCAVTLLALFALLAAWRWRPMGRSPVIVAPAETPSQPGRHEAVTDDPRLTFATPYRSVRPEVQYVGDDACSACHRRLFQSYRSHP